MNTVKNNGVGEKTSSVGVRQWWWCVLYRVVWPGLTGRWIFGQTCWRRGSDPCRYLGEESAGRRAQLVPRPWGGVCPWGWDRVWREEQMMTSEAERGTSSEALEVLVRTSLFLREKVLCRERPAQTYNKSGCLIDTHSEGAMDGVVVMLFLMRSPKTPPACQNWRKIKLHF